MKKIIFFIFFIYTSNCFSQSKSLSFSLYGNKWENSLNGHIINKKGEHILTGNLHGDSAFINGKKEFTNKGSNNNSFDAFIMKYDKNGNLLYKKQLWSQTTKPANREGIPAGDVDISLPVEDRQGNLFVLARFAADTLHIGDDEFYGESIPVTFLVKMDESGEVLWHKKLLTQLEPFAVSSHIIDMAVDESGNIVMAGTLMGNIKLDTVALSSIPLRSSFIASYSSSSEFLWYKTINAQEDNWLNGIKYNGNGNYYITGHSRGSSLSFGNDTLINPLPGEYKWYLASFDKNGNVNWMKHAASSFAIGREINTDSEGNIYIVGDFEWFPGTKLELGSGVETTIKPGDNFFLAKYGPQGNAQWVRTGHKKNSGIYGEKNLFIDKQNNIIVSGSFEIDTLQIGTFSFPNKGIEDIFLAVYDTAGKFISAMHLGAENPETALFIRQDPLTDTIYLAGRTHSSSLQLGNRIFSRVSGTGGTYFSAPIHLLNKQTSEIGLKDTEASGFFKVYPNPASGSIIVEFQGSGESVPTSLTITDITGKTVFIKEFGTTGTYAPSHKLFNLDVAALKPGMYFMNMRGGMNETKKVLIQR